MSNTTLTADIIAKEALAILDNELGWLGKIHRAHESEYSETVNGYKKGATISIRRPADFVVRTGATMNLQDVIEGKTTLTVDQQIGVDWSFTSSDLTLSMNDLSDRVIKPALTNIVNHLAEDVAEQMYLGTYNWAGTPGQTINSFTDFSNGPKRLDQMAVPMSDRCALLSPDDHWALIGAATALANVGSGAESGAYRKGSLGMLAGVDTYMSQVVPTHTNGTWDATTPLTDGNSQEVSYDTAKNTWTQSLITDGWDSSATITAGSVFTIDGVYMVNPKTKASTGILQNFVVTAAVTANATTTSDTTLTISPPIITSGPHQTVTYSGNFDGKAIVPFGSASTGYAQNLIFHKNAMSLAVVPMEMPQGSNNGSRQTANGLSVRVIPVYDGVNDVSKWRLDLLYGRKLIDPRLLTRLSGAA
jgi:hypothetical protein